MGHNGILKQQGTQDEAIKIFNDCSHSLANKLYVVYIALKK